MRLVRRGRTIRATEKSYEVLYKDRGFKPADELPDYDELTKADIRKELDKREVEYNKRDNKDELYSLLTGSD